MVISSEVPGVVLRVVGVVRSPVEESVKRDRSSVVAEVEAAPAFEAALGHIEEFSHLIIVFWMNRVTPQERSVLEVRPMRDSRLPFVGVFAARSPSRPNPIGVTTAGLLSRAGTVLRVRGLDAIDGTPVLDIKPCLPSDAPAELTVPAWLTEAWRRQG